MAKAPARSQSIVAILGADSYRAETALAQVLKDAGFVLGTDSVQAFRGDETTWTRLVDFASTGSLFTERRALVVRGADLIKGDGDELVALLEDPPPDVLLILVAAKADKRRTFWKKVIEAATVIDAEPLKGRALQSYVASEIRSRSLPLAEDAVVELLDRVGQDLRRLMGELDKLQAFAITGGGARISADDVARVLGRGLARPLYRLSDAMMERKKLEILTLLDERLEEGEPAQRILATLHRAVRQTRAARALLATRAPRDVLASRLGVPPFKIGDVMDAARQWSEEELRGAIQALSRADRRMKTGSDPKVALTVAVTEACGTAGAPRRPGAR